MTYLIVFINSTFDHHTDLNFISLSDITIKIYILFIQAVFEILFRLSNMELYIHSRILICIITPIYNENQERIEMGARKILCPLFLKINSKKSVFAPLASVPCFGDLSTPIMKILSLIYNIFDGELFN